MDQIARRIQTDNRFRFWLSLPAFLAALLLVESASPFRLLALTLGFLGYTAVYGLAHLLTRRGGASRTVLYLLLMTDGAAVTGLLFFTGLAGSPFFVLYLAVFGLSVYHRSVSTFVFSAVYAFVLYAGTLAWSVSVDAGAALLPVLGQAVLLAALTVALAVFLKSALRERREKERLVARAKTMAAVADMTSARPSSSRDWLRSVTGLVETQARQDGLHCRIILHQGGERFLPPCGGKMGVHIPILAGGEIRGTMTVTREENVPLSSSEVDFFSSIARSLGLALHRASLWNDLQTEVERVEANLLLTQGVGVGSLEAPCMQEHQARRAVEQMMEIIRVERGRWVIARKPFDMWDVVQDVVQEARYAVERKKLSFKALRPVSAVPWVSADREKIRKVIAFLVWNAVEGSGPGNAVSLSIDCDAGVVSFSVTDEILRPGDVSADALFDAAARRPPGAARSGDDGLLLVLCKQILQAHGGRVLSRPAPNGRGAVLGFSLPAFSDAAIAADLSPSIQPALN